ncbi:hypothetical protein EH165_14915 [Nakamurella antarctica]|uniref:Uncharacterized protein n=2 Tax=Nakamurella antarctica TaxID=1902245 RepID=A0A3G8ZQ11_9ACTN|nr:hypothetical protein EH165_14915 [Nakamurella antarctica]
MSIPNLATALAKRSPTAGVDAIQKPTKPQRETPTIEAIPEPDPRLDDETAEGGGFAKQSSLPNTVTARGESQAVARNYARPMSVYLPRSAHETLARVAADRKLTHTALMLLAINVTHSRLAELLNRDSASPKGDLFEIPQRTTESEPSIQTTIRVTDAQLDAIDGLALKFDSNRSKVTAAAICLYLD